jgi:hypothetical protein
MRRASSVFVLLFAAFACFAQPEKPLLLRNPSVSGTQIVFSYAGDLWIVNRQGGMPHASHQLTDERFNGGGDIADYIVDYLRRPLLSYWTMREGDDIRTPIEGIFGPKVMITNEMAGSGGEAMPWLFRKAGIGTLVGKRTRGGLVGHYTNPQDLIDGGFTGTPNLAFYTPESKWEIENHGVDPDVDVELDPAQWRQGHDTQLEKAVQVVLEQLQKNPPPVRKHPGYPNCYVSTSVVARSK